MDLEIVAKQDIDKVPTPYQVEHCTTSFGVTPEVGTGIGPASCSTANPHSKETQ